MLQNSESNKPTADNKESTKPLVFQPFIEPSRNLHLLGTAVVRSQNQGYMVIGHTSNRFSVIVQSAKSADNNSPSK